MLHRDAGERDVLLEHGRADAARDDPDLLAPDVHGVAVSGGLVAFELESDERALGMLASFLERRPADEVLVAAQVDREPDARLERVDLVVVLVAGRDQAGLDPQHVERVEAERCEAEVAPGFPDGVPDGGAVARMAEDLVPELARVAGPRDDDRRSLRLVDASHEEPEPSELARSWVGWPGVQTNRWRISRLFGPCTAMLCSCVDRGLHVHVDEPEAFGLFLQPDAHGIVACHEPEVVLAEAEHRALVDHAAVVVADRRVDDLAHRKATRVARDHGLGERLRVGAEHLELAQGGEVHDRRPLATCPVLGHGALAVEVARQPVARVLDDVAGERLPARLERGLLREHRRRRRGSRDAAIAVENVCSGP